MFSPPATKVYTCECGKIFHAMSSGFFSSHNRKWGSTICVLNDKYINESNILNQINGKQYNGNKHIDTNMGSLGTSSHSECG